MRDDAFHRPRVRHLRPPQLHFGTDHLVDEHVHAARVLHQRLELTGIARERDRTTAIVDAVAVRRLHAAAVIDEKRPDDEVITFVDDTGIDVARRQRGPLCRQPFVGTPHTHVEAIRLLQMAAEIDGSWRPGDVERA